MKKLKIYGMFVMLTFLLAACTSNAYVANNYPGYSKNQVKKYR